MTTALFPRCTLRVLGDLKSGGSVKASCFATIAMARQYYATCSFSRGIARRWTRFSNHAGGGYILCKNGVYQLNPAVLYTTDVDEFLQLYQAGRQSDIVSYERACQLYSGPFLAEDLYADWSFARREQLCQYYLTMCHTLAESYMLLGRHEDAAKWASAILKENRADEQAHRYLMHIYIAQGKRSEALRQYQRCEHILSEELGVPPMPETVNVLRAILTHENVPGAVTRIEQK